MAIRTDLGTDYSCIGMFAGLPQHAFGLVRGGRTGRTYTKWMNAGQDRSLKVEPADTSWRPKNKKAIGTEPWKWENDAQVANNSDLGKCWRGAISVRHLM